MSAGFWTNDNNYTLKAGIIELVGKTQAGVATPPIVIKTAQTVPVANLYAERAAMADAVTGNISFTNLNLAGWLNVQGNASFGSVYPIPPFEVTSNARVNNLYAENADMAIYADTANIAATANLAAYATNAGTSVWADTANVAPQDVIVDTGNVLTILNDPQLDYILKGVTANTVQWVADAGGAITAESFTGTSTATAAGTTALVSTDTTVQVFTGATTQTVTLPVTTGKLGMTFTIVNMSTGTLTLQDSAANAVDSLTTVTSGIYVCVATDGGANDWKKVASG